MSDANEKITEFILQYNKNKKCLILVDGNNFYHSIKRLGIKLNFEESVKLHAQILNLLCKATLKSEIKYYTANPNMKLEPEEYSKKQKFLAALKQKIPNLIISLGRLAYFETKEIILKKTTEINVANFDGNKNQILEFCKTCIGKTIKKEKKSDVNICIDLIECAMSKNTDLCYIFSGDADIVPAIKMVKKHWPNILLINVAVDKSSAFELRQTCHNYIILHEQNLLALSK